MSARNDSASRPANDPEKQGKKPRERRTAASSDLGKALKTVYDETVREDISSAVFDVYEKHISS